MQFAMVVDLLVEKKMEKKTKYEKMEEKRKTATNSDDETK